MKRIATFSIILTLAAACGRNNKENDLTAEELRDSLEQVQAADTVVIERNHTTVVHKPAINHDDSHEASSGSNTTTTSDDATTTPEEKKRMSNTAKGALIGAGTGIIVGAATSKKNRAKGAVIGGVIGTAAGAGAGAILDRKRRKEAEENEQ